MLFRCNICCAPGAQQWELRRLFAPASSSPPMESQHALEPRKSASTVSWPYAVGMSCSARRAARAGTLLVAVSCRGDSLAAHGIKGGQHDHHGWIQVRWVSSGSMPRPLHVPSSHSATSAGCDSAAVSHAMCKMPRYCFLTRRSQEAQHKAEAADACRLQLRLHVACGAPSTNVVGVVAWREQPCRRGRQPRPLQPRNAHGLAVACRRQRKRLVGFCKCSRGGST